MSTRAQIRAAVRRSSRRRDEGGAVLFVVAVTLSMLAAMGVYGLSATALDTRGAGHNRQATVGQQLAMHEFMLTAETFSPKAAQGVINRMYAGTAGTVKQATNGGVGGTSDCRTAAPYTGALDRCDAEACVVLTPEQLTNIANSLTNAPGLEYQPDSLGTTDMNGNPYPYIQEVRIEVTSPIEAALPPGYGDSNPNSLMKETFMMASVTVFSEVRKAGEPPITEVIGRGRIIAGPMQKPKCVRP